MATQLQGHESWMITGSWKTSTTVQEVADYVKEKGGGTGDGVSEEFVNQAVAPKADKTYVDTELGKKADKSLVPTKAEMETAIQVVVDDANEINERVATNTTAISGLAGTQTAQATAIAKLQTDKADKTALTKAGVGLDKVDNTADSAKPVSTAQKTALDKKVDLANLLKTIDSTPAVVHTGEAEVDAYKLDYGQHLIRTNNALNTPPDTQITLIEVIKTHDEVGSGGIGQTMTPEDFEQGTVSETNPVGAPYSQSKYPPSEPLHGSRIRNINPIPITEFSTITIGAGYQYCVLAFDEEQKYLGKTSFLSWDSQPRLTYPNAKFIAVAVKKLGTNVPIVPEDATEAKLTITILGQTSGGSKLLVAWGATKGDLHTCVNIAGAWSKWTKIGTALPDPADLPDGATIVCKNGQWVAVLPPVEEI